MNLWDEVLGKVEAKLNRHSFATWFRPTSFVLLHGSSLVVRVPSPQFKDWLAKNYMGVIAESLTELGHGDVQILLECEPDGRDAAETPAVARDGAAAGSLNPKYSFDSFVVGSSNQF